MNKMLLPPNTKLRLKLAMLSIIILAVSLVGCGPAPKSDGSLIDAMSVLDATPCGGYTGPTPVTKGQFSKAIIAEVAGRRCDETKLQGFATFIAAHKTKGNVQ